MPFYQVHDPAEGLDCRRYPQSPLRYLTISISLLLFSIAVLASNPREIYAEITIEDQVADRDKKILILCSYGYSLPAYPQLNRALLTEMENWGIRPSGLFFEYLDLSHQKEMDHRQVLANMLRHKYEHIDIDLIITLHWPAANFLDNEASALFPTVPVISWNIQGASGEDIPPSSPGQPTDSIDVIGTLEMALELFPKTRRIVFISGVSAADRLYEKVAREAFTSLGKGLDIEYTTTLPVEGLLTRIADLPPQCIVIYSHIFEDISGRSFTSKDIGKRIAEIASAPVFVLDDSLLGHGAIGGSLLSFSTEGSRIGRLALTILYNKIKPTEQTTTLTGKPVPVFDRQQIDRWGGKADNLSEHVIFINTPLPFWLRNAWYILGALVLLLGQLLLIGSLLVQRHRRGLAEAELTAINETLEQRIAERTARLQENEARYRSLFTSMTEGFALHEIICDADGRPVDYRFLEINPAFEHLTSLKRERVIGKTLVEIMPDTEPYWIETYGQVALGGPPAQIENYSAPLDRWYEVYAYNNAPGQFAVFFTDITERKRSEEALRDSAHRLSRAQEIAHLGSWELDLINNTLTWSDEVYRIFGLEPQAFAATYEAFLEHVHPEDQSAVNEAYAESIRTGRDTYEIEHRVIRSNTGEIRYVHEKCQHLRDDNGRIIRSLGMVLDITERRLAEHQLRQLSNFPGENPSPVMRCSPDGTCLYTNEPARRWLETLGWQDDTSPLPAPVRSAVAEAHHQDHALNTEITCPAGRTFGLTVVQPPGENYINLYGVDLTDRKKAQEALERSNKELEQFASVASHDLQEPLRAIVGFLQLLQSRFEHELDDKGKHFIDRSVKAAYRMQTLIRELLTLSRVSTKAAIFTPTDLCLPFQAALDNLQLILQEKNAVISCGPLPNLSVDQSQIRSLFQNLLTNAVRYNNSSEPRVDIGCEEIDGTHRFFVKDNGIGISPQFHQRIFMVFQRLHTDTEYPGTGLGLALCKKIVERHGGTIWVATNPTGGSIFFFTLTKDL